MFRVDVCLLLRGQRPRGIAISFAFTMFDSMSLRPVTSCTGHAVFVPARRYRRASWPANGYQFPCPTATSLPPLKRGLALEPVRRGTPQMPLIACWSGLVAERRVRTTREGSTQLRLSPCRPGLACVTGGPWQRKRQGHAGLQIAAIQL